MKKKIKYLLIVTTLAFSACKNEPDYKIVRQQVLDHHDQIMIGSEKAMNNKMQLDTLAKYGLAKFKQQQPALDTTAELQQIHLLIKKLNKADDRMSEWMQNFKTDVDGKTNAEAVKYFNSENRKIRELDSIYTAVLNESDGYLQKFNIKPVTSMKPMKLMKK
ncbi:hypothetical protein [Mucilaginibacter psychrotolerans]|uniref:Lipoprotein n=1 Tax=Mucilaginibacter psychrotolerans TaxID=1524096 RepID=A0A4Y8SMY9_9SPHI|nr:hypothetical protein [Mucilaginibacter psychrotolerans]TFF39726.1 hypothetical protein E2R66_05000 [Mucilaginibacter psychrotolerans]